MSSVRRAAAVGVAVWLLATSGCEGTRSPDDLEPATTRTPDIVEVPSRERPFATPTATPVVARTPLRAPGPSGSPKPRSEVGNSSLRACDRVEELLAETVGDAGSPPTAIPIEQALLLSPEGAVPIAQDHLTLDEAVATRFDPETLTQLTELQYQDGLVRVWDAGGTILNGSVFEFATPSGAIGYHEYVSRYACRFASDVYGPAPTGIGLELRYSDPPPVRDQIAWVVDNRRFVVSVAFDESPGSHEAVERLFAEAYAASVGE